MKIRLEQKNIGAAVMQIAEHDQFTAINTLKINDKKLPNSFIVNHDIVIICKYSTEPNPMGEYMFSFNEDNMETISELSNTYSKIFFGLVCVEENHICCLSIEQFNQLISYRKESANCEENNYLILVTAKAGSSFKAYVNAARKKMRYATKQLNIARSEFPNALFSQAT